MFGPIDGDAEQLGELTRRDDNGGGIGEADDHRMGYEVYERAQAKHAEAELKDAHHEGQENCVADKRFTAGKCEGLQGRDGQQGNDGRRSAGELTARAEQGGGDRGQHGCEQIRNTTAIRPAVRTR